MAEANPTGSRRRGPTLGDGLVLIAGITLGLAALRSAVRGFHDMEPSAFFAGIFSAPEAGWTRQVMALRVINATVMALAFCGGWTIVLPLYRRGRSWRRAVRQPGMVACLAAGLGMLLGSAVWAISITVGGLIAGRARLPFDLAARIFLSNTLIPLAGFAVAIAWSMLALSGRWRPARDWTDRVGVVVGVLWIVAGLVWSIRAYIF